MVLAGRISCESLKLQYPTHQTKNDAQRRKIRRAKGEGSLYKRADGKWVISVVVGHRLVSGPGPDADGLRTKRVARRKSATCRTKREAAERLRRLLATYNPDFVSDLSLADFLKDWLAEGADRWRATTFDTYESWVRVHITPLLGTLKVCAVTAHDVRNWQRELAQRETPLLTRARAHKLLTQAFGQLVNDRRIGWNPFKVVKPPKAPKVDIYVPGPLELRRLIAACPNEQVRAIVVLAATTLLRIGELLALRVQDLDLQRGRASVTATLTRDRDGRVVRGEPKTAASRRVVTLPDVATRSIRRHLQNLPFDDGRTSRWLFINSNGKPLERHNFRKRVWIPLLKSAGLPLDMHFHALRHAGNSLLLEAGVPVLVVAARCGHSDTRMTLDRYGHIVRAGADSEAAAITDRIFRDLMAEGPPRPRRS